MEERIGQSKRYLRTVRTIGIVFQVAPELRLGVFVPARSVHAPCTHTPGFGHKLAFGELFKKPVKGLHSLVSETQSVVQLSNVEGGGLGKRMGGEYDHCFLVGTDCFQLPGRIASGNARQKVSGPVRNVSKTGAFWKRFSQERAEFQSLPVLPSRDAVHNAIVEGRLLRSTRLGGRLGHRPPASTDIRRSSC